MPLTYTGGEETIVNPVPAGGVQIDPRIVVLSDGGWVIIYLSSGTDGSDFGIFQQRYDSNGQPVGGETQVNSFALGAQTFPEAAALPDGGWIVTWSSDGQDGSLNGIYQQRFDALGNAVGDETRVNTETADEQVDASVVALADGGWVVTWSSFDSLSIDTEFNILQQRYNSEGVAVGGETAVIQFDLANDVEPEIAALADGGWVVTWSSVGDITQQRFDAAGNPLTQERVNTVSAGVQDRSYVTGLADGGWVVVWRSDESGQDLMMQRYSADGTPMGFETRLPLPEGTFPTATDIVATADGGWVVTFQMSLSGQLVPETFDVYMIRFDAGGNAIGGATRIHSDPLGVQSVASVGALPDGGLIFAYRTNPSGANSDVEMRRFQPDIYGTAGADDLVGTQWDEMILGYGGDDTVRSSGGTDILLGGTGDDLYFVDSPDAEVREFVNQGNDTVHSTVSFSMTSTAVESLILTGAENINGIGNSVGNTITGNTSDNTLNGLGGDDWIDGGAGHDTLSGNMGNDVLIGGAGNDVLAGGARIDTANYASATGAITVNLNLDIAQNTGGAGTDTLVDIENLVGSAFNDTLTGSDADNVIEGGAGDDVMNGGNGIDTLLYASAESGVTVRLALAGARNTGGAGIDTQSGFENIVGSAFDDVLMGDGLANLFEGGAGNDSIDGNGGIDTANYASSGSAVEVDLALAGAQNTGGAGIDTLAAIENLIGTAFADTLRGNTAGNDLWGGDGNDVLVGLGGPDRLIGGRGADLMNGGGGADRFIFDEGDSGRTPQTMDRISGFNQGAGDRIALNQIDADSALAGNQAFTFVGTAAFTGTAGELRYSDDGTDTYVHGDTNGDGFADFTIRVDGLVPLVGTDFLL